MKYPTQERLKQLFNYNPDTGILTRAKTITYNAKYGDRFGCNKGDGYLIGNVDRKLYRVHRLIWIYVHNEIPKEIDHINGVRDDNRLVNLRSVSSIINHQNMTMKCDNTSGITGVYWRKDESKWRAVITLNKKRKHLGCYHTIFDAACARISEQNKHPFTDRHGK